MSKEQLAIRKEQRAGDNEQLAKSKGRAIFQEFAICYYSLFDFSVFVDAISNRSSSLQSFIILYYRNIVFSDIFISSNERHLFGKCDCNKQAIKRVTMNKWQFFKGGEVEVLNRNDCNVIVLRNLHKTCCISRKIQFAYAYFNSQFPCRSDTQIAAGDNAVLSSKNQIAVWVSSK